MDGSDKALLFLSFPGETVLGWTTCSGSAFKLFMKWLEIKFTYREEEHCNFV